MKSNGQTNFVYLLILISIVAMIFMNINQDSGQTVMTINELAAQITQGNIKSIVEDENALTVTMKDGSEKTATKESGSTLVEQLLNYGVTADAMNHANVRHFGETTQPMERDLILFGIHPAFPDRGRRILLYFPSSTGQQ